MKRTPVESSDSGKVSIKLNYVYECLLTLIQSIVPRVLPKEQSGLKVHYDWDYDQFLLMETLIPQLKWNSGHWLNDYKELFTLALDQSINHEFIQALGSFLADDEAPRNIKCEVFEFFLKNPLRNQYIEILGITEYVVQDRKKLDAYLKFCYIHDDFLCWEQILKETGYDKKFRETIYVDWFIQSICDDASKDFFERIVEYIIEESSVGIKLKHLEMILSKGTLSKVEYVFDNYPSLSDSITILPHSKNGEYMLAIKKDDSYVTVSKGVYDYMQELELELESLLNV